jgi:hypothetical protein
MSNLKNAKGNKVKINFGGRKSATFTAGGRKRYLIHKRYDSASHGAVGEVMVNGLIRFADGSEGFCLLQIDEASSGEHCGTGVFLPDGQVIFQNDPDFASKLGKQRAQVFPYKYKITGKARVSSSHHIGADGWSL